jgi:hypothetical protein
VLLQAAAASATATTTTTTADKKPGQISRLKVHVQHLNLSFFQTNYDNKLFVRSQRKEQLR